MVRKSYLCRIQDLCVDWIFTSQERRLGITRGGHTDRNTVDDGLLLFVGLKPLFSFSDTSLRDGNKKIRYKL